MMNINKKLMMYIEKVYPSSEIRQIINFKGHSNSNIRIVIRTPYVNGYNSLLFIAYPLYILSIYSIFFQIYVYLNTLPRIINITKYFAKK